MRRSVLAAALASVLAVPFTPAAAIPPIVGGALASSNVDLIITIPDVNAIGAKIIGDYMYVTTIHGVRIYDVSEGLPVLTGALEMPNWENESVDTNGETLLISADGFVLGGSGNLLVVVDVTNKNLPVVSKVGLSMDGHTATCIADCKFAWTSGNDVIDLADTLTTNLGTFGGKGYTHNWNVDAAGFAWGSDSWGGPGYVIDTNGYDATPLQPNFLNFDGYIGWHNSIRPDALLTNPTKLANASIDKGEVLFGSGEDLYDTIGVRGNCTGEDRVTSTWFHKTGANSYSGTELDRWSVGTDGTMAIPPEAKYASATFCSSHWLDHGNGLVAVAWYEQGTRILDVSNPSDIRQVGYFMPVETQTWAAYFHQVSDGPFGGGTYVYTIDLVRGIDVFKIDATAGMSPTVLAPHLNATVPGFAPSERFGYACRVPVGTKIEA